jgi:hypothetical protein
MEHSIQEHKCTVINGMRDYDNDYDYENEHECGNWC